MAINDVIIKIVVDGLEDFLEKYTWNQADITDSVNFVKRQTVLYPDKKALIFDTAKSHMKISLEEHKKTCSFKGKGTCPKEKYFSDILDLITYENQRHFPFMNTTEPVSAHSVSYDIDSIPKIKIPFEAPETKTEYNRDVILKKVKESLTKLYNESLLNFIHSRDIEVAIKKLVNQYPDDADFTYEYAIIFLKNMHKGHLELCDQNGKCDKDSLLEESITIFSNELDKITRSKRLSHYDTDTLHKTIADYYVSPIQITELKEIMQSKCQWDVRKLIRLCEEINFNWGVENHYSVIALNRMILHHVPPIFGFESFKEVANNYKGEPSFKRIARALLNYIDVADTHAHRSVKKVDSVPNSSSSDMKTHMDHLLGTLIIILKEQNQSEEIG